jgi:hypothetical protein
LRFHFEQYEIADAALVQTPGRAQSRDASSDDHDRDALPAGGCVERGAIAETVTSGESVVHEAAGDGAIGFSRKAD